MINDIYYKLNTCDFTCTFINKYPKRLTKVIFHADQIEGDKLVFNQDFFDVDKRIDTTYEIVIGYYNSWCDEAEVYQYESMFSEPKLIGKITRSEYVELMDCIHKKMV